MRLFSLLAYLATAEIIEYEQLDVSSMKTTRIRRDTVDAVESHRNNELDQVSFYCRQCPCNYRCFVFPHFSPSQGSMLALERVQ